jgi:hypothetical protein
MANEIVKAYGFTPASEFIIASTSGAVWKGCGRRRAGPPELYAVLPDVDDAVDTDYTFHAIPISSSGSNSETAEQVHGHTYLGIIKQGTTFYAIFKE